MAAGQPTIVITDKQARLDKVRENYRRRKKIDDTDIAMMFDVLSDLIREDEEIYRRIPDVTPSASRGTGIGTGAGNAWTNREEVFGNIVFATDQLSVPSHRVTYDVWGRPNEKFFLATGYDIEITRIRGIIEIEQMSSGSPSGGSPLKFWIDAPYVLGVPRIPIDCLVGFELGFLRYDHPKRFFIDTQAYVRETTNAVSQFQIVNEVPVAGLGARYLTQDAVLNDALLTAYDVPHGGPGLKFHCIFNIFGRKIG